MPDMNREQPIPTSNPYRPIWELVIEDMKERDKVGRERYGTPLQPFNGRNSLLDWYQELLDATVYCRQAIEEINILRAALKETLDALHTETDTAACYCRTGKVCFCCRTTALLDRLDPLVQEKR